MCIRDRLYPAELRAHGVKFYSKTFRLIRGRRRQDEERERKKNGSEEQPLQGAELKPGLETG